MFDAANSIERDYTPFRGEVNASSGASPEAAAAQAAHDVLVALIPASAAQYHSLLQARLATLPPGRAAQGVAVGKAVAANILAWRNNDGSAGPTSTYVLPVSAGLWQSTGRARRPDTGAAHAAVHARDSDAVPRSALSGNGQRALQRPISTRSRASAPSTVRRAHQPRRSWRNCLPPCRRITTTNVNVIWNNVVRDVTLARHLTLLQSARLYALMNVATIDGLQTSQTGKFIYGLWRPVTAIRAADTDPNGFTVGDPAWTPLLGTPPYPTYPGNMACIGAASARAMELGVGTDDVSLHGDVGWRRWQPADPAVVHLVLATRPGRSRQPHLWRHSLPLRQRREPAGVSQGCGACRRPGDASTNLVRAHCALTTVGARGADSRAHQKEGRRTLR